jgi:hypothetical protein
MTTDIAQARRELAEAIVESGGAEVRSDEERPVKRIPGPGTFELTCDGPGWKALPVVNGHVCPMVSVDVHVDAESFPRVTLRLIAAEMLKLGFSPAEIEVDGETRAALVSLGWTPPDDAAVTEPAPRRNEITEA